MTRAAQSKRNHPPTPPSPTLKSGPTPTRLPNMLVQRCRPHITQMYPLGWSSSLIWPTMALDSCRGFCWRGNLLHIASQGHQREALPIRSARVVLPRHQAYFLNGHVRHVRLHTSASYVFRSKGMMIRRADQAIQRVGLKEHLQEISLLTLCWGPFPVDCNPLSHRCPR